MVIVTNEFWVHVVSVFPGYQLVINS